MRTWRLVGAIALTLVLGAAVGAGTGVAYAGQNSHFDSIVIPLGNGGGSGPPPGCPVPGTPLAIVATGNGVMHESTNNNGDWGGGTFEGTGVLEYVPNGFDSDGNPVDPVTPLYSGHVATWGGGGNNKAGQSEGGDTLTFQGTAISAAASSATIYVHVDGHTTTNNAGTTTANFRNITCTA
jgi:hypothetical protein